MSDTPLLRVIIYDIADNGRRRRVAKALEERAVRVQESAFEARLTARQLKSLLAKLEKLTTNEDSVRSYTVPESAISRCHVMGDTPVSAAAKFWLL